MSQAQFLANSTATRRRHKEHEENSLTAERASNIAELLTILLSQYPCGTNPCIDPIFGPTQAFCWSLREGCVVAGDRYLNYLMIRMSG